MKRKKMVCPSEKLLSDTDTVPYSVIINALYKQTVRSFGIFKMFIEYK